MSRLSVRILLSGILICTMGVSNAVAAPKNIGVCGIISEPGSYVLTKNLNAIGDCLTVTADYVTIDLGGFTIFGDGTGAGIKGDGTRLAITMRDGTITNLADGIDFCSAAGPSTAGNSNAGILWATTVSTS
jgi:hypothetical protein